MAEPFDEGGIIDERIRMKAQAGEYIVSAADLPPLDEMLKVLMVMYGDLIAEGRWPRDNE